jgi:hypothetical protein
MKTNMKFTVTIALAALLTAGLASTAQAAAVGLPIIEEFALDGTPTASAFWSSDPGAVIHVTRDLTRTDGRVWLIDLTGSGHQVNWFPVSNTWNDINSPGRWNNLYWDDALHLHLESEWPTATGNNMGGYPNGFDNGVSYIYGNDSNGDSVYASVTKKPVPFDPCAAGFTNAYAPKKWTTTGIADGTSNTLFLSETPGYGTFSYAVNLGNPGPGVSSRTATFQTIALGSRTFSFNYDYTGFHAYFATYAVLQVFADGPAGTELIDLVNGPVGSPFAFSGSASIQTHHGFPFGFIVGGSNYDYISILQGDLKISNVNGDADNNAVVDKCEHCTLLGDLNCDQVVDLLDLALLAENWLKHS